MVLRLEFGKRRVPKGYQYPFNSGSPSQLGRRLPKGYQYRFIVLPARLTAY